MMEKVKYDEKQVKEKETTWWWRWRCSDEDNDNNDDEDTTAADEDKGDHYEDNEWQEHEKGEEKMGKCRRTTEVRLPPTLTSPPPTSACHVTLSLSR